MNNLSIAVFALPLLATACNSGHWVDTPILTGYLCDPKGVVAEQVQAGQRVGIQSLMQTPEQIQQGMDQMVKLQAQGTCGKTGGAFTGDTRCENGAGQVKCSLRSAPLPREPRPGRLTTPDRVAFTTATTFSTRWERRP